MQLPSQEHVDLHTRRERSAARAGEEGQPLEADERRIDGEGEWDDDDDAGCDVIPANVIHDAS